MCFVVAQSTIWNHIKVQEWLNVCLKQVNEWKENMYLIY